MTYADNHPAPAPPESSEQLHNADGSLGIPCLLRVRTNTKKSEMQRQIARLEAENQELRLFSARLAHEVRAPIRAIDGMSAIILADLESAVDSSSMRHLKLIRRSASRLGLIIDDLLSLARVSEQPLRCEPVNLSKLVESIASVLFHANPHRDVRLTVNPHLQVVGDPGLLRMVLSNLVGNAWKFSRNVAVAEIEVGRQSIEGRDSFFVRDNGAGFNMDQANKLFEPFVRLHRQEEFDGTGIGLSLVKRIVERHDGKVWAHGVEGKGATFFFNIRCPGELPCQTGSSVAK